jgi:hypothetical protein
MGKLTQAQKDAIIDRRGSVCDRDGRKHRILEVHHKDRDPENNDPKNLRVLCPKHHDELHGRD